MEKLFEIQGKTVIPKMDCYLMHPINDAIDKYGTNIVAYLHYMKSMRPDDNPYADVPLKDRSDLIIFDLKLEINPEDPTIQSALQCVEEKYYTTFYGVYRGVKAMMDDIGKQLLTTTIDFTAREGNASNIIRLMEKYEQMRKSFKVAYRDFEEEQGSGRARGGAELADDEDEDY